MIALVLAGGFARRLEPLTLNRCKPLLPVGGKPVLQYSLDALNKAGIKIIVSTNAKFGEQVKNFLDELPYEVKLLVEPTMKDGEKFGAVKAVHYAVQKFGIKEDLIIVGGDNYSPDLDYAKLASLKGDAVIVVYDVKKKSIAKRMGVIELDGDKVVRFWEKPEEPRSTLVSTFGQKLSAKVVANHLPKYLDSDRNKDNMGCFYEWLINQVVVRSFTLRGAWIDIGSQEALLDANEKSLERCENELAGEINAKIIGKGVVIKSSLVKGTVKAPVFMGKGCVVHADCVIGPNVELMEGVNVGKGTIVKNSVVMEEVRIGEGCRVENSIINNDSILGRGVELKDSIIGEKVVVEQDSLVSGSKVYPNRNVKGTVVNEVVSSNVS
ncbi:MAG: NDP-sugar synthase [Nanoarchaeota archaeon]|nr:NDP-sugar synthase [Nanoarchaeota archaeon]